MLPQPFLEDVAKWFRQLGEPMRLRLLQTMGEREWGVGDLADAVESSVANVSRHLQALHECGLVERRRQGTNIYYRVDDPVVFEMCGLVCKSVETRLKRRLGN